MEAVEGVTQGNPPWMSLRFPMGVLCEATQGGGKCFACGSGIFLNGLSFRDASGIEKEPWNYLCASCGEDALMKPGDLIFPDVMQD